MLVDLSIRRPILALVCTLLLILFGLVCASRMEMRELPDNDPPVVTVETTYPGASAAIVESRVTQIVEEAVSGIEGIRFVDSASRDGLSEITIEFSVARDIDGAANDVRDRVSRILADLPDEANAPEIAKVDANNDVVLWMNLASSTRHPMDITDYAERFLVDRFATVDGVARVRVAGARRYSMRVWLDRQALASHDVTVSEVEDALREQNVELPAGRVESLQREFTVRKKRLYSTPEEFARLPIRRTAQGHIIRLGDVARVEIGPQEQRDGIRGNGQDMVGMGVIMQSGANLLDVATKVKAKMEEVRQTLPEDLELYQSSDSSFFIDAALKEVFFTLLQAVGLVMLVIYVFLGSARAMAAPAVIVTVSILACCLVLYPLGFSINLLTLLAFVLAIDMLVDDSIVIVENISRRMRLGEPRLAAAALGTRQVAFAMIVTTASLVAVFLPLAFVEGRIGRLFTEFAVALCAACMFSTFQSLSLSPMLCAHFLTANAAPNALTRAVDRGVAWLSEGYGKVLAGFLRLRWLSLLACLGLGAGCWVFYQQLPKEFAPLEDRARFTVVVNCPEGASLEYTKTQMRIVESALMPFVEQGQINRALTRWPRSWASTATVSNGLGIAVLHHWDDRNMTSFQIAAAVRERLGREPGMRAFPVLPPGLGINPSQQPVQFILGGATYEQLAQWRDAVLARARRIPGLLNLDADYKETKPQLLLTVDVNRAADLGIPVAVVGRTLETLMGSRDVTTFMRDGEEYEVMLEAASKDKQTPADMEQVYVRSGATGALVPLSSLVRLEERAEAGELRRFNRLRAITIQANLSPELPLGQALEELETIVREEIGPEPVIDYKGESREYREASGSLLFAFGLACVVVYLVLAAQFESFRTPLAILLTVPLAVAGALAGLALAGATINVYSQIGVILLIGVATKNGILIIEFANQLREEGMPAAKAALEAARLRLRPILMTASAAVMGAVPLLWAQGAAAESRIAIGTVIFAGVVASTVLTLFLIPGCYLLLTEGMPLVSETGRELDRQLKELEANGGAPDENPATLPG